MAKAYGNIALGENVAQPGDPLVSPDGNTTVSANNDGTASITRPVTGGGTETRGLVVAPPYDAEIEWLEADGSQEIDTGVHLEPFTNGSAIEMRRHFVARYINGSAQKFVEGQGTLIGRSVKLSFGVPSTTSEGLQNWPIVASIGNSQSLSTGLTYSQICDKDHVFRIETEANGAGAKFYFDGTSVDWGEFVNGSGTSSLQFRVFNGVDSNSTRSCGRIYYVKLWDAGVLVFDGYPVRKNGLGYLYDKVSGILFGNVLDNNAGFAAACCGPDKVCATQTALAPVYDSSKTYAVGACVTHEGSLWKCTTAVSTAEAFNGAKWQNVTLLREALCDIVYPVGSIYTSVNSTSPATLFGGIWERITGRFLLAGTDSGSSGADQAPGNTGGEATHTLTASELPKIEGSFRVADNVAVNNNRASILIDHSGVFTGTTETGNQVVLNGGTHSVQSYSHIRVTNLSFGSDSEHNNMPPYLSVYVWKRTA